VWRVLRYQALKNHNIIREILLSYFSVSGTIPEEELDTLQGYWYSIGVLGSEERVVSEGILVTAYFNDREAAQAAFDDLKRRSRLSDTSLKEVMNQDWNRKWRESMQPALLAPGVWVSPIWLPPSAEETDTWIKIEPKMAFGTGHHETTRLASRALLSRKEWLKGKVLLDIGTGSGILCFVADLCGSSEALGIEIDKDCLENLSENRSLNPSTGKIGFLIGTLDCIRPQKMFDIIIMNMLISESKPLLPAVSELLRDGGMMIWSGILKEEREEAIEEALRIGCRLAGDESENEWWCGIFLK